MPSEETRVVIIYGFLGSGKTTLMLKAAERVTASGKRAAIVVNEAGKVPVDGKLLSMAGLPVREIFAGCICCSVVGDFVETLAALRSSGELSCILVEPSGMADAPRLFKSLVKHGGFHFRKVLVLDGIRLALLMKVTRPLMEGQIREADLILLNKMDAVNGDDKDRLCILIEQCAHDAPVYPVSVMQGLPEALMENILMEFSTYSEKWKLSDCGSVQPSELLHLVLQACSRRLPPDALGHAKAYAEFAGGRSFAFSTVTPAGVTLRNEGHFAGGDCDIGITLIFLGIPRQLLRSILFGAADEACRQYDNLLIEKEEV